jgi:hypothetical protein
MQDPLPAPPVSDKARPKLEEPGCMVLSFSTTLCLKIAQCTTTTRVLWTSPRKVCMHPCGDLERHVNVFSRWLLRPWHCGQLPPKESRGGACLVQLVCISPTPPRQLYDNAPPAVAEFLSATAPSQHIYGGDAADAGALYGDGKANWNYLDVKEEGDYATLPALAQAALMKQ